VNALIRDLHVVKCADSQQFVATHLPAAMSPSGTGWLQVRLVCSITATSRLVARQGSIPAHGADILRLGRTAHVDQPPPLTLEPAAYSAGRSGDTRGNAPAPGRVKFLAARLSAMISATVAVGHAPGTPPPGSASELAFSQARSRASAPGSAVRQQRRARQNPCAQDEQYDINAREC